MSQLVFAAGVLLHVLGLIIWAGGEIWITMFVMKSQKSPRPHGRAFILEVLKTVNKMMWTGAVLLGVGGVLRIIGMNAVSLWTDPSTLWGAMMLTKHGLLVIVIISSIIISTRVSPTMEKNAPGPNEQPSETFLKASELLEKLSRTNFLLTMIVIVISVGAVAL